MSRHLGVAALLGLALAGGATRAQEPAPASQVFRVSTDLLLIDATVLDRTGQPVPDLTPADFLVRVDGQSRRVQSAHYIAGAPAAAVAASPAAATSAFVSTNAATNRLLVIAVDEAHLRWSAKRAVVPAAAKLLEQLSPGDLVALARLPGGGGVEFTADRQRILDGIQQIVRSPAPGDASPNPVNVTNAVAAPGFGADDRGAAVARDLRLMELRAKQAQESASSLQVLQSIQQVVTMLSAARVPAKIVLISERLYIGGPTAAVPDGDRSNEITRSTQLAALTAAGVGSRVTIDVVSPNQATVDLRDLEGASDPEKEQQTLRGRLPGLAETFGGEFFPVVGDGADAFARIGARLSGYYLLGIETTQGDRAGKPVAVRVESSRPGLVVRQNKLTLPIENRLAAKSAVRDLLSSPVPIVGVPLRLATFAAPTADKNRLSIIVSAEIGDGSQGASVNQLGLIVVDQQGKMVTQTLQEKVALPASRGGAGSPLLFLKSITVPPGDYTLRLAVVAADGSVGSVQHPLAAHLDKVPDDFEVSALVVAAPGEPGESPRILPSPVVSGGVVSAVMSVTQRNAKRLDELKVTYLVMRAAGGDIIASAPATARPLPGNRREFSVVLPLAGMAPGNYVMRAVVNTGAGSGKAIGQVFRIE